MITPWSVRWRLVVRRGLLEAELRRGRRVVAQATARWDTLAALTEAIARLPSESSGTIQARAAYIEIARPLLQRRMLPDLPPLRRAALRALVGHQSARFFRSPEGTLVTDVWCFRRDRTAPVEVVGVAAEEALVTAIAAAVERAGLVVRSIRPAVEESLRGVELLPPAFRMHRTAVRRRRLSWGLAVVATLSAILLASRVISVTRENHRITARLDSLRAPLAALALLRGEMDRAGEMLGAQDRGVRGRGLVPQRLLRLVAALSDSAVLSAVTIDIDGEGRFSGLARRPLDVVAELDRRDAVANPRLEGGTVREMVQGRPWERFTVGFGQRGRR